MTNQPSNYLLRATEELHTQLAVRPNASSATIEGARALQLTLPQAMALALNTLGGAHAPIRQCFNLVSQPIATFRVALPMHTYIPGWGSSFFKGEPDPMIAGFIKENLNTALATCYATLQLGDDAPWAEAALIRGRVNPWIWTYESPITQ